MLNKYAVYPDKLEPNIVLHEWVCQGKAWYAVDTYSPLFEEEMSDLDKAIAFESAMGYRLRYNQDIDETYYIPPIPVENGHIKRLLNAHKEKILNTTTPVMIGFKYDGMIPGDCSHKNTIAVVEHLISMDKAVMISTAYTPSSEIRSLAGKSNGQIVFEIRIPGIMGVDTPSLEQIGFTTRRLYHYGNETGYFLRFGPLVRGISNERIVNISSFWTKATSGQTDAGDNVSLRMEGHRGNRLLIPNEPIVPTEYLNIIHNSKIKSTVARGLPVQIEEIKQVLEDAWKNDLKMEIFGHESSEDKKLCSSIVSVNSQNKIPKHAIPEFIDTDKKYHHPHIFEINIVDEFGHE